MSWEKIIQIQDIIRLEGQRQEHEIELIASENYVSKNILAANGSILTNKYSEGYPGKRYYAGQKYIDQIENIAIDLAKEIFDAEYVNVQPLSGSPANLAVFSALLVPGDRVLSLSLDHGGHLTHGHPLNESGRLYVFEFYWVDPQTELINMNEVRTKAHAFKPKLIIAWFSAYSRSLDWAAFRAIADEVGALLMGDIAHIAGLVAAKQLQNPIPFCDVVTTTTHKTLRGPRWAIILSREKYAKDLARAVFPWAQGGPHDHTTAAKAIAFAEALSPEFAIYGERVIKNAQEFAQNMIMHGARIVSGWTDNHLFCIDVAASYSIGGKQAELLLEGIGISVNKNMIPFDIRKPLDPSGIRLGTPAVTTRGMGIPEMQILAIIIHQSLSSPHDIDLQKSLALQVRALCDRFPIYQ
jgi:glycine hydroxymethyltransferase